MSRDCDAWGTFPNHAWEDSCSEVRDTCRENGLLVSAEEDVLMLFPALTITRRTAERGLDLFEKSL